MLERSGGLIEANARASEVFSLASEVGGSVLVVCVMIVLISRSVGSVHVFFIFWVSVYLWLMSSESVHIRGDISVSVLRICELVLNTQF